MKLSLATIPAVWLVFGVLQPLTALPQNSVEQTQGAQQTPEPKPVNAPVQADASQEPEQPAQQEQTKPESPASSTPGCEQTKDTCELPPEPAQPATPPTTGTAATQEEASQAKPSTTPKSGQKKKKKKSRGRKQAAGVASEPKKIVVRDGGTSEPRSQLTPGAPGQQQSQARQNTDQLLASTQANLKTVSARTLNAGQQATVEQIKMFIEQANSALKAGDLQRGHNLAMKAHLLSDDLLRH